ncbi:MAG: hypothetical protein Q8P41_21090 [Pseudomonadota bacterium]|nr:hypothetical protein [Pseudomonadota bacterium]
MTDAELEELYAGLPPVEPPRELQLRVLTEVGVSGARIAELTGPGGMRLLPAPPPAALPAVAKPSSRWRLSVAVGALALAAAALLVVRTAPPEQADPDALVPRGDGEVLPALQLRVAVKQGDHTERLALGRSYGAGDTLLFRVSASAPMDLVLRREGVVLYKGRVPAGDTDLPVGYALEAGEAATHFVVEGGGTSAVVELAEVRR